jgi:hypothetical protein
MKLWVEKCPEAYEFLFDNMWRFLNYDECLKTYKMFKRNYYTIKDIIEKKHWPK